MVIWDWVSNSLSRLDDVVSLAVEIVRMWIPPKRSRGTPPDDLAKLCALPNNNEDVRFEYVQVRGDSEGMYC